MSARFSAQASTPQQRRDEERRSDDKIAQLASIIESSGDAVVSSNLDGIVTSWNRGAEALYGYTAAEVVGRPNALFVPSERGSQVAALIAQLERGEAIGPSDTVRRREQRLALRHDRLSSIRRERGPRPA